MGRQDAVLPLLLLLVVLIGVLLVPEQQHHHRRHRQKQHTAFAQRIESTVAEDHSRHHVGRAGLLQAVFQIVFRHLVVDGVIRLAEGGHRQHRRHQNTHQRQADQHSAHRIPPAEPVQPVLILGGELRVRTLDMTGRTLLHDEQRLILGLPVTVHPFHQPEPPALFAWCLTHPGSPSAHVVFSVSGRTKYW